VFVLFVGAGLIKLDMAAAGLPVDFTALMGAVCGVAALVDVLRRGFPETSGMRWIAILFTSFAVPLLWTDWTPYSSTKATSLFALTFTAAIIAPILFRDLPDLKILLVALAASASILALEGLVNLLMLQRYSQLFLHNSDPTTFGRHLALGSIWACSMALLSPRARVWCVLLLLLTATLVYAAGSRGAVFGLAGCMVWLALLAAVRRRMVRTVLIGAVAVGIYSAGMLNLMPTASVSRVNDYVTGEYRVNGREGLFADGLSAAARSPLGGGWGSSEAWNPEQSGGRFYFHNIFLELAVECGWAVAVLFAVVVLRALRVAFTVSWTTALPEHACFAGWFVFLLFAACISGDVNDNRLLFALIPIALNFRHYQPGFDRPPARAFPGSPFQAHRYARPT
jgi:hypothetical protein